MLHRFRHVLEEHMHLCMHFSRREMSMIAAHAAWHMCNWDEMSVYVDTVDSPDNIVGNKLLKVVARL